MPECIFTDLCMILDPAPHSAYAAPLGSDFAKAFSSKNIALQLTPNCPNPGCFDKLATQSELKMPESFPTGRFRPKRGPGV